MIPDWVDRNGMCAWVEGMASAVRRRVAITDGEGYEIMAEGVGDGKVERYPLMVNGVLAGWVLIQPGGCDSRLQVVVEKAVGSLSAMAENRNSMVDLIQTNAGRWRELAVLYESTQLLRAGQNQTELARGLLRHTTEALECTCGAVSFRYGGNGQMLVRDGQGAESLADVASWAGDLSEGILFPFPEDLADYDFSGTRPDVPFLMMPISCNDRIFGGLAVGWPGGTLPTSEHLKLAGLLAGQAGLAFSNLEMVEQVRSAERIQRDLEVAATIQNSILPPPRYENDWLDVSCMCEPAALVGGDAFIVSELADGAILAGVADVSGHGLPAALLLNSFDSQFQALATTQTSPARLMENANGLLTERIGAMGMFITAALLRFEENGALKVANAGHPPPIMVDAEGNLTLLEDSGLPLGILGDEEFEEQTVVVPHGAFLVTYSDGVTEALSEGGIMYGMSRLIDAVRAGNSGASTSIDLQNEILADLRAFTAGAARSDDLTLVVVRRK